MVLIYNKGKTTETESKLCQLEKENEILRKAIGEFKQGANADNNDNSMLIRINLSFYM